MVTVSGSGSSFWPKEHKTNQKFNFIHKTIKAKNIITHLFAYFFHGIKYTKHYSTLLHL